MIDSGIILIKSLTLAINNYILFSYWKPARILHKLSTTDDLPPRFNVYDNIFLLDVASMQISG
jgi:hypothetical protein